jgi:hypothetical protein
VTWRLDGAALPNPSNGRNVDLGARNLAPGAHTLSATVTDPANPGGASETLSWTVDNVLPTAPRELSEPLSSFSRVEEQNVYFGEFDMRLDATDDQPGFVVGEFRLNGDGWFQLLRLPRAARGDAVHLLPLGQERKGVDVREPRHGRAVEGDLRAVLHGRPPERRLRARVWHT